MCSNGEIKYKNLENFFIGEIDISLTLVGFLLSLRLR